MIKFLGLICLSVIGVLYLLFLIVTYVISMVYLLLSELLGTKQFRTKIVTIHKTLIKEFKETLKTRINIFG